MNATKPPPDDLKAWSKNELVREVRRLRAIMREHSERRGDDPRAQATTGAAVTSVDDDPHGQGSSLLDTRAAVLMDTVDVVLVDTKREEPVSMMLAIGGRINYATDRVEHTYLFGPDGAAALVSQLVGLAARAAGADGHGERFATEFQALLDERMRELP
jgi:hypothetical protein